jgi:hypothetical protein
MDKEEEDVFVAPILFLWYAYSAGAYVLVLRGS